MVKAATWLLLLWDTISPMATSPSEPVSVTVFPTISPSLQRKTTTELLSDAGTPLTSAFLVGLVNDVFWITVSSVEHNPLVSLWS